MGCSSSKEQVVKPESSGSGGTRGKQTARSVPAPVGRVGSSRDVVVNNDSQSVIMVMDLNDMEKPMGGGTNGEPQNRDRFLSYASGASTPTNSQGNLSWDANLEDHSNHNNIDLWKKPNSRILNSSGSAIRLDELHAHESVGLSSKVVHIEVPFGKPIEEVYDGVHNGPVLGSGVSGIVRLVTHKATGVQYAVKCLDLGMVGTKAGLAQLREEVFIMCQLDHPNIVRLEEVYESHSEIYLVQELCLGGELFDRLDEQPNYHYTEAECARLVKQMLSAVRYLHSKGIIHRDLKLENFLFSSKAADSDLKMIDFGLSKHFRFGEVHTEAVGTPYTVAPEVILGSYDERCDIWAIGVISYLLLSGDPPFGGCGGPEPLTKVRTNILECRYSFIPEEIWAHVSDKGKDFVRHLLIVDPKKRPTAKTAQKDPWLKEWAGRSRKQEDRVLNPNVVKALVSFKEFSHMRKLLSEVLSFTLLPDQITELRKEFETLDTEGSGEISLAALKQVLVTNAGAGSLGALTEEEVEDIFDAMRVNKAETRIHWHEFIAAGLSHCQVDDRNLRLAFDRLDSDHKGYITLDDIMNLVGNDELHSEEELRTLWKESMKSVACTSQHIAYDDFLLLMKGQTREPDVLSQSMRPTSLSSWPEDELESEPSSPAKRVSSPPPTVSSIVEGAEVDPSRRLSNHSSSPNVGPIQVSFDVDVDAVDEISANAPDSPTSDQMIGEGPQDGVVDETARLRTTAKPSLVRGRSKSLANEAEYSSEPTFQKDVRRALALPERDRRKSLELASKSSLAVTRELYRAHRQMRVAVLEVSRRFEEEQTRRARDNLMAEKAKEAGMSGLGHAGLVMRHGHKVQVSTQAIRDYLERDRAEQQELVEKATRRCGRGERGNRKKTISDMSAMMNPSFGQDEMAAIIARASHASPDIERTIFDSSASRLPPIPNMSTQTAHFNPNTTTIGPSIDVVDPTMFRNATVPGQFQQTTDPFSSDGMYGGARVDMIDVNQIMTTATRSSHHPPEGGAVSM